MRYPERERRRITALRRRYPELSEPLSFLERISAAAPRLLHVETGRSRPESDHLGPPIAPRFFPLDETAAAAAFRIVAEALLESTGSEAARAIHDAIPDGRLALGRLARAYCEGDAATFQLQAESSGGLDPELLAGLAELAVKPQFIVAAQALQERLPRDTAESGVCPACGSRPELAVITDANGAEGIMLAVCRLCESEWPVQRVRCLNCGNADAEALSYLQEEGEESPRIHICQKCRHYLPVLDARGRLEFAPAVERVALAPLEIVAQDRGWEPYAGSWADGRAREGIASIRDGEGEARPVEPVC